MRGGCGARLTTTLTFHGVGKRPTRGRVLGLVLLECSDWRRQPPFGVVGVRVPENTAVVHEFVRSARPLCAHVTRLSFG
jgi:hypothetical protein